jgi:hypothetical protein
MAIKQRTDISWMGELFERFEKDLPAALETHSLPEWGEAVAALGRYIAARHKPITVENDDLRQMIVGGPDVNMTNPRAYASTRAPMSPTDCVSK